MERGVVRNAAVKIARASFRIEFGYFFVDLDLFLLFNFL